MKGEARGSYVPIRHVLRDREGELIDIYVQEISGPLSVIMLGQDQKLTFGGKDQARACRISRRPFPNLEPR